MYCSHLDFRRILEDNMKSKLEWRNGRRRRLKISCPMGVRVRVPLSAPQSVSAEADFLHGIAIMRKGLRRRAALPVATPFPLSQGLLRLRHEPARQRPDPEEGTCPNMKKHPALNALPFLSALPGVVIGSHVMRLHQIPLSASLQNIGALLAGGLVSFLFLTLSAPRRARSGPRRAMPPCCCASGRSAAPFWIQASGPFIGGFASGRWP